MLSANQIEVFSLIFACWDQFKKNNFLSIIFWAGIVENGCGQNGNKTLKLKVSKE